MNAKPGFQQQAAELVNQYVAGQHASLNDAIAGYAKSAKLNQDQVGTLVTLVNRQAFMTLMKQAGQNKFALADAGQVSVKLQGSDQVAPDPIKVASVARAPVGYDGAAGISIGSVQVTASAEPQEYGVKAARAFVGRAKLDADSERARLSAQARQDQATIVSYAEKLAIYHVPETGWYQQLLADLPPFSRQVVETTIAGSEGLKRASVNEGLLRHVYTQLLHDLAPIKVAAQRFDQALTRCADLVETADDYAQKIANLR